MVLIQRGIRNLLLDAAANVLPMATVAIILLALLAGGAVDMSRAYLTKNKLQSACDAATLAGRRAVSINGFDTTAQQKSRSYFNVNFNDATQGTIETIFTPTSADSGNTITATASTKLNTVIMRIFNFNQFNLTVVCSASMGAGNSDVVLVLDNTGSMADDSSGSTPSSGENSKIQDLQVAMKNFYSTLSGATAGTNARIRYGFVPFSSSVNVGRLLYGVNPNFIKDSNTYQSRAAVMTSAQVFDHWADGVLSYPTAQSSGTSTGVATAYTTTSYSSRNNCQTALPVTTNWVNDGSSNSDAPGQVSINGSGQRETLVTVTQRQIRTSYVCQKNNSNNRWYRYSVPNERNYYTYTLTTQDPIYTSGALTFDHWSFQPVTYDTSTFKTFASVSTGTGSGPYPATMSSTWSGCIEERQSSPATSFSYSGLTGISPDLWDLDIDTPPDLSDNATKWAPMWPQVSFWRYTSGGSKTTSSSNYGINTSGNLSTAGVSVYAYGSANNSQGNYACPAQAKLLAEMTQSEFNAYADSLTPVGGTYLDLGLLWGARTASPDGIFASTVNLAPNNGGAVGRHIIFMTDGIMDPSETAVTAYGMEYWDRRVTTDGSSSTNTSNHTSRFRALCDAVKDKGIRVWVIAFGTSLTSDLTYCASSNSAFQATNGSQLNAAFQEIAHQVGELRIIQ